MEAAPSIGNPVLWAGFLGFVVLMLALDLGVFHRKPGEISVRDAALWSGIWVALSGVFAGGLAWRFGEQVATEFVTGYLVEKSLSVDNLFVFVVVFASFGIPRRDQHRVLFWGILSALVLRGAMIFAGAELLARFHAVLYLFGAFLIFTGVRLAREWKRGEPTRPEDSRLMRAIRRALPSTTSLESGRFTQKVHGRRVATPLLLALVTIELSDIVFAVDSIPAIFAITDDPFIVFTSNIFALLGLRSLFFLLEGMVQRFELLKLGLAGVLVFVGLKMSVSQVVKIPDLVSLAVIALILASSVLGSIVLTRRGAGASSSRRHA